MCEIPSNVIQAARATGRKIGICGQAPSDYPEFAQCLVEQGIDSISLHPDAVLKTLVAIAAMEQPLRVTGVHRPAQPASNHREGSNV